MSTSSRRSSPRRWRRRWPGSPRNTAGVRVRTLHSHCARYRRHRRCRGLATARLRGTSSLAEAGARAARSKERAESAGRGYSVERAARRGTRRGPRGPARRERDRATARSLRCGGGGHRASRLHDGRSARQRRCIAVAEVPPPASKGFRKSCDRARPANRESPRSRRGRGRLPAHRGAQAWISVRRWRHRDGGRRPARCCGEANVRGRGSPPAACERTTTDTGGATPTIDIFTTSS